MFSVVETPAFILDETSLASNLMRMRDVGIRCDCRMLYSVKALGLTNVLYAAGNILDGYSVSSLYEARLARDSSQEASLVCFVSPVCRHSDIPEIASICDRMTVNSVSQFHKVVSQVGNKCDIGIRVNPQLSFLLDHRYDPCRPNSKAGVPLLEFCKAFKFQPEKFSRLHGLHFHSNCDSEDVLQLIAVLKRIEVAFGEDLGRFRWLNLGGGYLFSSDDSMELLADAIAELRLQFGMEIVMEPGAAISRSAGCLVSTVEDILEGDEGVIAILDTTVNHWPEVFEYQFEPDVEGHVDDGPFTYQLAGCSCLAGDLFGVYSFNEPLEIGSRVVFRNAGAYSIVKAHMFNGINLPNIYTITEAGELVLVKRFTYKDFTSRCGVDTRAVV